MAARLTPYIAVHVKVHGVVVIVFMNIEATYWQKYLVSIYFCFSSFPKEKDCQKTEHWDVMLMIIHQHSADKHVKL